MTFLKNYGLGAVGFTMLVTAVGLQYAVFVESFWHQLIEHGASDWDYVDFNIYSLLNALYGKLVVSCFFVYYLPHL